MQKFELQKADEMKTFVPVDVYEHQRILLH